MIYIISYDITKDSKRKKVSKELEEFGYRKQYSLFECNISRNILKQLTSSLPGKINIKTDSILFLPLCENCYKKRKEIGVSMELKRINSLIIS